MSATGSILRAFGIAAKALNSLATWLDPVRRERVILLGAIRAAKEIIAILERSGQYKDMQDAKLLKLRIHYQKQLNAWEDGQA